MSERNFTQYVRSSSGPIAIVLLTLLLNISETTRDSDSNIYPMVALDSLYIWIENDATIYFRLASSLVVFGLRFLDNCSTDFENVYPFGIGDSDAAFATFSFCKTLDIYSP